MTGFDFDVIIKTTTMRMGVMKMMNQVKEMMHTDIILMRADALLIDAKLLSLIGDVKQGMTQDEIIARLEEIREISHRHYAKLRGW